MTADKPAKQLFPSLTFNPDSFHRRVLLTGAGWSYNFGGYLANSFRYHLLSRPEIRKNPDLANFVRTITNFESIFPLAHSLGSNKASAYSQAVLQVFEDMNLNMARLRISRQVHRVNHFLNRFTAWQNATGFLFTLNQDLWFESNYQGGSPRQPFVQLPAVRYPNEFFKNNTLNRSLSDDYACQIDSDFSNQIDISAFANVVKLHGSANWYSADKRLIILGTDKLQTLYGFPILAAYNQLFSSVLSAGDVRLFVIGYSWRDKYINAIVEAAVENFNLKLWIMDVVPIDAIIKTLQEEQFTSIPTAIEGYIEDPFWNVFGMSDYSSPTESFDSRIEAFFDNR